MGENSLHDIPRSIRDAHADLAELFDRLMDLKAKLHTTWTFSIPDVWDVIRKSETQAESVSKPGMDRALCDLLRKSGTDLRRRWMEDTACLPSLVPEAVSLLKPVLPELLNVSSGPVNLYGEERDTGCEALVSLGVATLEIIKIVSSKNDEHWKQMVNCPDADVMSESIVRLFLQPRMTCNPPGPWNRLSSVLRDEITAIARKRGTSLATTDLESEQPHSMVTVKRIANVVSHLNPSEPISPSRVSELLRNKGIKPHGKNVGNAHAFKFDEIRQALSSALGSREIPKNYREFLKTEAEAQAQA